MMKSLKSSNVPYSGEKPVDNLLPDEDAATQVDSDDESNDQVDKSSGEASLPSGETNENVDNSSQPQISSQIQQSQPEAKGKKSIRKNHWTKPEDSSLRGAVAHFTKYDADGKQVITGTWSEIAGFVKNRTAKQCRERWTYNLNPIISTEKWTPKEDQIILDMNREKNNQWAMIAKMLPGRTENAVKTRYKSIMRARKREWKPEEDEKILRGFDRFGSKWEEICEDLPDRTANAVKTRFSILRKGSQNVEPPAEGSPRQVWYAQNPVFHAEENQLVGNKRMAESVPSSSVSLGSSCSSASSSPFNGNNPEKRFHFDPMTCGHAPTFNLPWQQLAMPNLGNFIPQTTTSQLTTMNSFGFGGDFSNMMSMYAALDQSRRNDASLHLTELKDNWTKGVELLQQLPMMSSSLVSNQSYGSYLAMVKDCAAKSFDLIQKAERDWNKSN